MDLADQSTVVQQKTRRRGTRKEDENISMENRADKGSKMARWEKTNSGTTDDSDWSGVVTDESSVADVEFESPSANGRRTHRRESPAETRRQQSSPSVRQLAAQRTYLHNNNNTSTVDAMSRYAAEPHDQPLNFGRVIPGGGRRRSQRLQPTTCRRLRMYTVVVNRRRLGTTSTDRRRTTAEIVTTDVRHLPNGLRQSTDIYRRSSTDLPT